MPLSGVPRRSQGAGAAGRRAQMGHAGIGRVPPLNGAENVSRKSSSRQNSANIASVDNVSGASWAFSVAPTLPCHRGALPASHGCGTILGGLLLQSTKLRRTKTGTKYSTDPAKSVILEPGGHPSALRYAINGTAFMVDLPARSADTFLEAKKGLGRGGS